jgi:hypothetical protein
MCVDRLNVLKLAPGGHLGRLIIWTESAFRKLDTIFGTYKAKVRASLTCLVSMLLFAVHCQGRMGTADGEDG